MHSHSQNVRPTGMMWRNHFRQSLLDELVFPARDAWSAEEQKLLGASLAQFQLGESSDGRWLLRFARRFGDTNGDAWLGEAMALFIQEENRHSQWLGEFLRAQGHPLLRACWQDTVFRLARKGMGFGLMVSCLVCAEIVAVPYYTAVRQATASIWLQAICARVLRDEAMHLQFQSVNLGAVWRRLGCGPWLRAGHRAVLAIVAFMVWQEHGHVLRRGGYTWRTFRSHCQELLAGVHEGAQAVQRGKWEAAAPAPVR